MRDFAILFENLDRTHSTNDKVRLMADYFSKASSADAAWALFFLSGHRLKRLVGSRLLMEWCLELTGLPAWLVEESYTSVGDSAETVALLLKGTNKPHHENALSLHEWMEQRILSLRELSADEQKTRIFGYWEQLEFRELFILNKLLTGSFRVGVSSLLTLKALSQTLNIPRETLSHRVMGNWEPSADYFEQLKQTDTGNLYLNPYPFYLAYPIDIDLQTLGDPCEWLAEWKWDGIRAQAVVRGGEVALWSRGNELISQQFPEILESLKSVPNETVLDGEILAYKNNTPLAFGELQKRLGRKNVSKAMMEKVPIVFMIYDLLEYQGLDYREHPLSLRREIFETFKSLDPRLLISPKINFNQWEDVYAQRLLAKNQATEGIMLKKLNSTYGVGRRKGNWWKYKVDPMTIDAVLMYAQAGSGRRANLFTDYTFGVWHENELIPIAKAYSGLDQSEINELDHWIRRNTLEKFGPVRKLKAHHVFELAFEGIQASKRHKSGVALRFPRISRWRKDKPYEECDILENIKLNFLHEQS